MKRWLFSSSAVVLVAATMAAACAAPASNAVASDGDGLAVVEVRIEPASSGPVHVEASARFVAVDDPQNRGQALDLLGLGWPAVSEGACLPIATEGWGMQRAPEGIHVDLRDRSPVGLRFSTNDGHSSDVPLEARSFPDVVGMVSGVVFVAPKGAQLDSEPQVLALDVQGGDTQLLELPELPRVEIEHGDNNEGITKVPATGFVVRSTPPSHPDDRVVIEVVRGGASRMRCSPDRSGHLWLSADAIGGQGELSLLVRAQRRTLRAQAALDARMERDVSIRLFAQ